MSRMNDKKKKSVTKTINESDTTDHDSILHGLSSEHQTVYYLIENKMKSIIDEFNLKISERDNRIAGLEQEVINLKRDVSTLSEQIDDAQAYERKDSLILSGPKLPLVIESENTAQIISDAIKDNVGVIIPQGDISIAHRVGRKSPSQTDDKRNIIVKFRHSDVKQDILQACRRVKPKDLYINECLTPTRSTTLYGIRQAKKKFPDIIAGYGSINGKVFTYIKPPSTTAPLPRNTRMFVNSKEKFADLCSNILNCEMNTLVNKWPSNL